MKILLLTHNYPLGKFETFLEHEIDQLSNEFNQVYVLPTRDTYATTAKVRSVPQNVNVIRSRGYHSLKSLITSPSVYFNAVKIFLHAKKKRECITSVGKFYYNAFKDAFFASHVHRQISTFLKKTGPVDAIYCYWCAEMAIGAAFYNMQGSKCHVFVRAHRYDLYVNLAPLKYWPYVHFLNSNVSQFCPISKSGKEDMIKSCYRKDKISIHYLGVPDPKLKNPYIRKDKMTIVSCSRIEPVKCVNKIFNLSLALSKYVEVEWIHFGSGSLESELIELIKNKPSKNLHVNLRGHVSNQVLLQFYSSYSVDYFVNLSSSEGVPVSIMEAMSFGIPAIATSVGGTSELVDAQCGILLDVDEHFDLGSVANLAATVFSDEKSYREMREHAYAKWLNNYSANDNYKKFALMVKKIIS